MEVYSPSQQGKVTYIVPRGKNLSDRAVSANYTIKVEVRKGRRNRPPYDLVAIITVGDKQHTHRAIWKKEAAPSKRMCQKILRENLSHFLPPNAQKVKVK